MRIFISWSGERSRGCATALAWWIPQVLPDVLPWLSLGSIPAGARWDEEVSRALAELHYGVLCLTPENVSAEWVLFEAGALSKSTSRSRVVPYLLGFEPHELRAPLAQFQAVRGDEKGSLALIRGINAAAPQPLEETGLFQAFHAHWPLLSSQLDLLAEARRGQPVNSPDSSERGRRTASSRLQNRLTCARESPAVTRRRIARKVRALRVAAGLTQEKLAEQLGVHYHYVSRIEGGVVDLTIDVLVAIASKLNVTPGDLMNA